MLTARCDLEDQVTICHFEGEIDSDAAAHFREVVAGLQSPERLVLDLGGVVFMDSAGLGALIGGIRRIRERGGEVVIASGRPPLTRLLLCTGLDRVVAIVSTTDEAADLLQPDRSVEVSGPGPL